MGVYSEEEATDSALNVKYLVNLLLVKSKSPLHFSSLFAALSFQSCAAVWHAASTDYMI